MGLLLLSFFSPLASAMHLDEIVQSDKAAVLIHPDRSNSGDLFYQKRHRALVRALENSKPFGIPKDRIYESQAQTNQNWNQTLTIALEALKGVKNPVLVVAMHLNASIERSLGFFQELKSQMDLLSQEGLLDDPKIWIVIDASNSGKAIREIKKIFRSQDVTPYTNGSGHYYSHDLVVVTSSSFNASSWAVFPWSSVITKHLPRSPLPGNELAIDAKELLSLGLNEEAGQDAVQVWSSSLPTLSQESEMHFLYPNGNESELEGLRMLRHLEGMPTPAIVKKLYQFDLGNDLAPRFNEWMLAMQWAANSADVLTARQKRVLARKIYQFIRPYLLQNKKIEYLPNHSSLATWKNKSESGQVVLAQAFEFMIELDSLAFGYLLADSNYGGKTIYDMDSLDFLEPDFSLDASPIPMALNHAILKQLDQVPVETFFRFLRSKNLRLIQIASKSLVSLYRNNQEINIDYREVIQSLDQAMDNIYAFRAPRLDPKRFLLRRSATFYCSVLWQVLNPRSRGMRLYFLNHIKKSDDFLRESLSALGTIYLRVGEVLELYQIIGSKHRSNLFRIDRMLIDQFNLREINSVFLALPEDRLKSIAVHILRAVCRRRDHSEWIAKSSFEISRLLNKIKSDVLDASTASGIDDEIAQETRINEAKHSHLDRRVVFEVNLVYDRLLATTPND